MKSKLKLGLIGCGKMGGALIGGAIQSGIVVASDVFVSSRSASSVEAMAQKFGATGMSSNAQVATASDVVLLCTKPADIPAVLEGLSQNPDCMQGTVFISAAAGLTLAQLEGWSPAGTRMIRCMPNTPSLIGKGAAGFALGQSATTEDAELAQAILGSVGKALEVPENLMNAVTGVSGSGPAYVYSFIEAMAEGGVAEGLPLDQALELAVKTVQGAAAMVEETGMTPDALRTQVTSPGGTTQEALTSLENNDFKAIVMGAVQAAAAKAKSMGA